MSKFKPPKQTPPPMKMIKAMTFQEVLANLKKKAENPPPPLSPEKQEEVNKLLKELGKDKGFMAFGIK